MDDNNFNLKNFFEKDLQKLFGKYNTSPKNQKIIKSYITTIKVKDGGSESTVKNNAAIITALAANVQCDLDQLTKADVNDLLAVIDSMTRKEYGGDKPRKCIKPSKAGEPRSDAIKQQYTIGLKRFLTHYGTENDISALIKLATGIKTKKIKRKIPEIITIEEVKKLIDTATHPRDKALIAVLYESGARIGEHNSCRIKDVELNEYGCTLTFIKSKTTPRKIQLVYSASYLRVWLENHPRKDDDEAPLWCSIKDKNSPKLDFQSIGQMLTRVAQRAGIKKRIYPHLFRHSRATHLAQHLTEQELKTFLGWTPNSGMAAVYVHISGQAMQDSVLKMFGLKQKRDIDSLEIDKCPRCKTIVSTDAKYCDRCGMPLSTDAQEKNNTASQDILAFLASDPELMAKLTALVQAKR